MRNQRESKSKALRRFASVLLVLVLVLSYGPVMAVFAEDAGNDATTDIVSPQEIAAPDTSVSTAEVGTDATGEPDTASSVETPAGNMGGVGRTGNYLGYRRG